MSSRSSYGRTTTYAQEALRAKQLSKKDQALVAQYTGLPASPAIYLPSGALKKIGGGNLPISQSFRNIVLQEAGRSFPEQLQSDHQWIPNPGNQPISCGMVSSTDQVFLALLNLEGIVNAATASVLWVSQTMKDCLKVSEEEVKQALPKMETSQIPQKATASIYWSSEALILSVSLTFKKPDQLPETESFSAFWKRTTSA